MNAKPFASVAVGVSEDGEESVWVTDAEGRLFNWVKNHTWEEHHGVCALARVYISKMQDQSIWGIDAEGEVYTCVDYQRKRWGHVDTSQALKFVELAVVNGDNVWGLSRDHQLYRWQPEFHCWDAVSVKIDPLHPTFNSDTPLQLDRDSSWFLYKASSTTASQEWTQEHAADISLISLSATATGELWGVGMDGKLYRKRSLERGCELWSPVSQDLDVQFAQVAACSYRNVWVIQEENRKIWHWDGTSFVQEPLSLAYIATNGFGHLWAISGTEEHVLYRKSHRKLRLSDELNYVKIWDDRGTGAKPYDGSFWYPYVASFHALGAYCERSKLERPLDINFENPTFSTVVVAREENETASSGEEPLLLPPVSYERIWCDAGTGGEYGNFSLWQPIPPNGYAAMGCAISDHHTNPPAPNSILCVHKSLLKRASIDAEECLWSSRNTRATSHCSLWMLNADRNGLVPGTFVAVKGFDPPSSKAELWCFNLEQSYN